jgi:ketosteroid isomerase-like protein
MSVRDLELVRRAFGAYGRGDLAGALSALDEGFEIVDPRCNFGFVADHFLEAGDRVVVLCRRWGRDTRTGARVERRFALAWTVRHGRIRSMEYFPCWASALQEAAPAEVADHADQHHDHHSQDGPERLDATMEREVHVHPEDAR